MAQPKFIVKLDPSVGIDPIPTGAGGIVRGQTIMVTGGAACVKETFDTTHPENGSTTEDSPDSIKEVAVQLGASGPFVKAIPTGPVSNVTHQKTWTTWTTGPRSFPRDTTNKLAITALVSAGTGAQAVDALDSVTVSVDGTPPHLDLTTPNTMTKEVKNGQATFTVQGTAHDDLSPVVAVEWVLDQGTQVTPATPRAPGDWSSWTADLGPKSGAIGLGSSTRFRCAGRIRWEKLKRHVDDGVPHRLMVNQVREQKLVCVLGGS